jgi:CheY-like chemotaxis protein
VVENALQMSWNEIRHRAQLVKDYQSAPNVLANEARLGQVFLNLLINAAQAIPEGQAEKNRITVRIRNLDQRVAVEVQDTGGGMPQEVVSRIFDPFFTTKPVGQGTGLGLTICQGIVQGMGGEIEVTSAPGKGSLFRVLLPTAARAQTPEGVTPIPVPPGRRGRVLVVDDEPLVGATLGRTLAEDHEVVVTTSAREALGRLAGGERYDVILCDVMMPDITGYELYEELARYAPDQARRMIFLTGGAFTPRAQKFLGEVENKRVEKPFDAERVRGLVRMMVK